MGRFWPPEGGRRNYSDRLSWCSSAMRSKDVFVHISAVERAGMSTLNEGQRLTYEIVTERGKQAASNLQNA